MHDAPTFRVLIVGAGSAALEAAFRLQHVGENRMQTTILAPGDEFATHAMAVLAPFAAGDLLDEPLARLASQAGAQLRRGRMASVDADAHEVMTTEGEAIRYDALLIAESGFVRRIAFVVPAGATWPVPLYELALMAADRAYEMGMDPELTLVTWERAPLGLFGAEASGAPAGRLAKCGIAVVTGVHAEVPAAGLKQGGLACQQADAAADAIAAQAGAAIEPEPYAPILQGVLLTQRAATYLRREASADQVVPDEAVWWPPTEIAGRELSRHLGRQSPHTTAP